MLKNSLCWNDATKGLALVSLAVLLLLVTSGNVESQKSAAAKLLNEATYYQSEDDTSDRAAELYRQLILKYPASLQAEQAQFYLGTYYQNKFFIVEHQSNTHDWSSFNQAEDSLYTYIKKYPGGSYLADAYYALAMISLRRGYNNKYRVDALSWLKNMSEQRADDQVYLYKVVWSPDSDDVVKRNCQKNLLAVAEAMLLNRNSTFENFTIALTEWSRNNCR